MLLIGRPNWVWDDLDVTNLDKMEHLDLPVKGDIVVDDDPDMPLTHTPFQSFFRID